MLFQCSEPGCEIMVRARPGDKEPRCVKCAAYHRGRKAFWKSLSEKERAVRRKRKARAQRRYDETHGREEIMECRARVVNDLLKGK